MGGEALLYYQGDYCRYDARIERFIFILFHLN
jgi:hypothetical protein